MAGAPSSPLHPLSESSQRLPAPPLAASRALPLLCLFLSSSERSRPFNPFSSSKVHFHGCPLARAVRPVGRARSAALFSVSDTLIKQHPRPQILTFQPILTQPGCSACKKKVARRSQPTRSWMLGTFSLRFTQIITWGKGAQGRKASAPLLVPPRLH